ncbi:hypothetical protein N7462_002115 [Penicillium macrosclerotiorum]|uniref:uncharacterized protein n=1 Tax=Penicillium macrosclerotiorum TaxID=303699 RepID=UPI002547D9AB|nr:uncharacterized protein N7462_002115 [Penicillium macrosclerotiorum]KAJ5692692.1 hypothetical protein N7462_002115 [Penicillium macrosclerotiorum]
MELAVILLLLGVFSGLPSAYGWTFVWRNASDNSFVEHDQQPMSCTKINNGQGELFEWDSEEGPFAISLYSNTDCSGSPSGYATHIFNKNASKSILSFKVDSTASTMTSVPSKTSSSTSISTTSTTSQTNTSDAAVSSSSSASGLSGGTIAGIIIGVIAGMSIIAGVLFWLRQRSCKTPSTTTDSALGYNGSSFSYHSTYRSPGSMGSGRTTQDTKKTTPAFAPKSAVGPVRMVELQGHNAAAELSSHGVNELESPNDVKFPTSRP